MWRGLLVQIDQPRVPVLRVETGPDRRFRIVQGTEPILWCRIWNDWYGVDVVSGSPLRAVVEPIRAVTARHMIEPDPARWLQRWAHHLTDRLAVGSNGPFHAGSWTVRPVSDRGDPAPDLVSLDGMSALYTEVDEGLRGVGEASLGWDITAGAPLVPLRPLSDANDGRVKAYRKLVRDRSLPPVLVWFVGGLAGSVIIDGHDRFVASLAEGFFPPMLQVARVLPVDQARERMKWTDLDELARLQTVLENQPDQWKAHEALARTIVKAAAYVEEIPMTLTWPSSVGIDAWPFMEPGDPPLT